MRGKQYILILHQIYSVISLQREKWQTNPLENTLTKRFKSQYNAFLGLCKVLIIDNFYQKSTTHLWLNVVDPSF